MIAFSGSIFCIELVMSSQSGGRKYDSSAKSLMQMYSFGDFTHIGVDVVNVVVFGEYCTDTLYAFKSFSGDDGILSNAYSLP